MKSRGGNEVINGVEYDLYDYTEQECGADSSGSGTV